MKREYPILNINRLASSIKLHKQMQSFLINVAGVKKLVYALLLFMPLFFACESQEREFPDYDYTTAYFPYQTPVRTIVLGEDLYDNSLDNAHKCKIMATMGGVYKNNADRILNVTVDNSLFDSLLFNGEAGSYVRQMPASYYSLASNMQIVIPSGSISGGIEVQLTDAFFSDPDAVKKTYVIPLRIVSVKGIDSVLRGKSSFEKPNLFVASEWSVAPKDYILYCIKYINPWHGAYLRRGTDIGTGNNGNTALDTSIIYHKQYVEKDQVAKINTISMDEVSLTLITREKGSTTDIPVEIRFKIDNAGKCIISKPGLATYAVSGTGQFVKDGDTWGGEKRDVFHLNYKVDFGTTTHSFTDTLVLRDRGITMETFTPVIPL